VQRGAKWPPFCVEPVWVVSELLLNISHLELLAFSNKAFDNDSKLWQGAAKEPPVRLNNCFYVPIVFELRKRIRITFPSNCLERFFAIYCFRLCPERRTYAKRFGPEIGRLALKIKKLPCLLFVAAGLGLSILGCSKTDGEKSSNDTGKVIVAQIDDQKIDATVLEKYLESRPVPMNAENTGELLKKKLDELVVEELLYREALRLKLDEAPDTRQKIREILNSKLTTEQIHKTVMQRKIESSELQAYYNAHQSEFSRPEEVRVSDIFIAVPKDAPKDQRLELKQKAEAALAEALALTNRRTGFTKLIQKYSDPPEKYTKGDTGFFNAEGKPGGIDPRIVETAFFLEKSGDIPNTVIEAEDGYHILMLNGNHAAYNRPFEQAERDLKRRIINEEVQKKRDELILELKAKAKISIDEKAMAQFQEKLKTAKKTAPMTPAAQNFHPMPGTGNPSSPIMGSSNQPPVMPNGGPQEPPGMGNQTGNTPIKAANPFVAPRTGGN
jgi:parvulin-like peptidyl-prolyl isomerase